MPKLIIIFIGLVLFTALGYVCAHKHHSNQIQADIDKRVNDIVARYELDSVELKTDGRDVYLNGVLENQEMIDRAYEIVQQVDGVRLVNNHLKIIEPKLEDTDMPKDATSDISNNDMSVE